jgi:murein DD-endopeptidase MepM/ murein hydrolase activator NlpD
MRVIHFSRPRKTPLLAGVALLVLAACDTPLDPDLRGLGEGFSTTEAALNAAPRPQPDARGIISYPNYQVVVAQQGDTVRAIALRLGINAEEVARHNALDPDAVLRAGELVALPTRVGTAAPPGGDVTTLASAAIDRAGDVTTTPLAPATPAAATSAPAAPPPAGAEPIRHQVQRGETAYSIARLYNVPVTAIAEWNSLGPDLAIREGQQLLVPTAAGASPPASVVTPPGSGSPSPVPPSAATPLPAEVPPPASTPVTEPDEPAVAPDLGAQQSAAPASQFAYPIQGPIIRAYVRGRNDGIDIGAPAGAEVRASAGGTVAAVTTNTDGIEIVVIRHADNLLTVYTHVTDLTIAKDQSVSQGQVIGRVRAGDPSFVHFEIRRGMDSIDPTTLLP